MKSSLAWKISSVLYIFAAAAIPAHPQTLTSIGLFTGMNGSQPTSSLVQGIDGAFYGTTTGGGKYAKGVVFRITAAGVITDIHDFCAQTACSDGAVPYAGLLLATDGSYYGTTTAGGANNLGVVFRISQDGTFYLLHSFAGPDGATPYAGLVEGTNGKFYGTTVLGGSYNLGTVFEVDPDGRFTSLRSFGGVDGALPYASLMQASNGLFYGTTSAEGSLGWGCGWYGGCGTVFAMTSEGELATIHSFNGNFLEGITPYSALIQANDGNLYGTTYQGGESGVCTDLCGTVYRVTTGGIYATLYNFCGPSNCRDGSDPYAGVVQATDGALYGATYEGGLGGSGTLFNVTLAGKLTTLFTFCLPDQCGGQGGGFPYGGVIQGTNGTLYGTTEFAAIAIAVSGPYQGSGTIYSLDMGLGPFVSLLRNVGKTGQGDGILGQGLTEVSSVSFNGTPASFSVVSDTFIKATVPAGATTGYVTVTTPSGTLTSNVPFYVLP